MTGFLSSVGNTGIAKAAAATVSSVANAAATLVKAPIELVGDVVTGRNVGDALGAAVGKVGSGIVGINPVGVAVNAVGEVAKQSGLTDELSSLTLGISDRAFNIVDTAEKVSSGQGLFDFGKNQLGATERNEILKAAGDGAFIAGTGLAAAATLGAAPAIVGAAGGVGAKIVSGQGVNAGDLAGLASGVGGGGAGPDLSGLKDAANTVGTVAGAVRPYVPGPYQPANLGPYPAPIDPNRNFDDPNAYGIAPVAVRAKNASGGGGDQTLLLAGLAALLLLNRKG